MRMSIAASALQASLEDHPIELTNAIVIALANSGNAQSIQQLEELVSAATDLLGEARAALERAVQKSGE
jgi:hypothetical protein